MKRTPLLVAAVIPLVAAAGPGEADKAAYEKLKKDVPVTQIMGTEVTNRDGDEIGEVEDVVISADGSIKSILVDRTANVRRDIVADVDEETFGREGREYAGVWGEQDNDRMQRLATTEWAREEQHRMPRMGLRDDKNLEKTAGYESEGYEEPRNVHFEWQDEGEYVGTLTEIDWNNVSYDMDEGIVEADVSDRTVAEATYSDEEDFTSRGEVLASKAISTEVNLLDEDSFGEIEDILIDVDANRASAYLVDSIDILDRKVYAFPAKLDAATIFRDEVNYEFTSREVEEMGEFDVAELQASR